MSTADKDPSVISLELLEPAPLEDPPSPVETSHSSLKSSTTTSSSVSSYIPPLIKTQRYSAYAATAFLGIHLTSTAIIPLLTSIPTADKQILFFRPTYQGLLTEPLLVIAPITLHVFSGISLRLLRGKLKGERHDPDRRMFWLPPPVSTISGLGFLFVPAIISHIGMNRVLPLEKGITDSINLSYVAHGFALHPAIAWTAYGVLISAGSWHVVLGAAKYLGWEHTKTGGDVARRRRKWLIWAGAAFLNALWLAGAGVVSRGGLGRGWEAREWNEVYNQVLPLS